MRTDGAGFRGRADASDGGSAGDGQASPAVVAEGQKIFRFDTFGDEQVWTDTLRLHEVVEKSVDPTTALKVGLKVDADVLPPGILEKVDLKSPATTVALLKMNAVVGLPPAYGLARVTNETYTAEGPISYWNAYVAITQMGGQGNFSDPRLRIDVKHSPDMVTSKLPALRAYQHSLPAPPPPAGSVDTAVAQRGRAVFDRTCASCHVGGSGTDNNTGTLHMPVETGVDGAYAARTPTRAYRTTPLRGLWQHAPYFHDGSAATLADVVAQYNRVRTLGLTAEQQRELVEYLKSL